MNVRTGPFSQIPPSPPEPVISETLAQLTGQAKKPEPPSVFPWEDPEVSGWEAVLATLSGALLRPGWFFGTHLSGTKLSHPMALALFWGSLALMLGQVITFGVSTLARSPYSPGSVFGPGAEMIFSLGAIFLAPLPILIWLTLGAVWFHFCLLIFKAGTSGLAETFRVVCYSTLALAWWPIPILGPILAPIHLAVVLVIGLSSRHKVGSGRVFSALILVPLILGALTLSLMRGAL